MSFQNITDLNLGKILTIAFSEGVKSQMSRDYRDFEMVKMAKSGKGDGREIRFFFQNSLGPAAIQYSKPGISGAFPAAQQVSTSEHTAVLKELNATIELEYNLWKRAQSSPEKYAEPLAIEMQAKMDALKRLMARDFYGDGTGVIGQVASIVDGASSVEVTLNATDSARGFVGWFEYADLLKAHALNAASVAPTVTGGTFYAWRVKTRVRKTNKVVLEPVAADGSVLGLTASNLVATNVFYRVGQPSVPDLTAIVDYGTASEVIAGLESLAAADGRLIHGITMSGISASSEIDCGGSPLDVSFIQEGMDNVKVQVGQGKYKWPKLIMSPEAHAALIESRETDRRFQSVEDNKRGVKVFAYVHGDDVLECYTSEFVPKNRIYALPESKGGDKVLEFHGLDFEPVKANDMSTFHLKPGAGGGHQRTMTSYIYGSGVLICNHPASIMRLRNFTV